VSCLGFSWSREVRTPLNPKTTITRASKPTVKTLRYLSKYRAEALFLDYEKFKSKVREGEQYDAGEVEDYYEKNSSDFKFKPAKKSKTSETKTEKSEIGNDKKEGPEINEPLYKNWEKLSADEKTKVREEFILYYFKNPSTGSIEHPLQAIARKLEIITKKLNDKNYAWSQVPQEKTLAGSGIRFEAIGPMTRDEIEKKLGVTDLDFEKENLFEQQLPYPTNKAWIRFRLVKILPLDFKSIEDKEVSERLKGTLIDEKLNEKLDVLKIKLAIAIEKENGDMSAFEKKTEEEKQAGFEKGAGAFANKEALKGLEVVSTTRRNLRKYGAKDLGLPDGVNFNELRKMAAFQVTYKLSDATLAASGEGIWIAWLTDLRIPKGKELEDILKQDTARYIFQCAAVPLSSVREGAAKLVTEKQLKKRYESIKKGAERKAEYLDGELKYRGVILSADINAIKKRVYLSPKMMTRGREKFPALSEEELKEKLRTEIAESKANKALSEIFDYLSEEKDISDFAKVNKITVKNFPALLPGKVKERVKAFSADIPEWDFPLNAAFTSAEKSTPVLARLLGKKGVALQVIITATKSPGIKPLDKIQEILKKELAETNLSAAAKNKAESLEALFKDGDFEKTAKEKKLIYRESPAWNFSDGDAARPFTLEDKIKLFDLKEKETLAPFKIGLTKDGKFIETYAIVSLKEIEYEDDPESVERVILKRRRNQMMSSWVESWEKSVNEQGEKLKPATAIKKSKEKSPPSSGSGAR